MSIINNVLKDLEARPNRFTPIEIAAVGHAGQARQNRSKKIALVILPICVIFSSTLIYYEFSRQSDPVPIVELPPVKSEVPDVDKGKAIDPTPNQITGMQIRESVSQVSLEFSMHEKAVSYLKERSENRFIFHIKNIRNEIEAPRISQNRWIEDFDIETSGRGVDLILTTVPGVLVNTAQLSNQNDARWTIQLQKLPEPEPTVVEKLQTVESQPQESVAETGVEKVPDRQQDRVAKTADPLDKADDSGFVKVEIKSTDPSSSASAQLNKAMEWMQAGQWQQAEVLLKNLVGGALDFAARKQLMAVYSITGKDDFYLSLAQQSLMQYPRQVFFETETARALFKKQQYTEVISLLENTEDLDASRYALLAASYQRKDQHQKAVKHYHHALKLDKRQARNWIGLGISLEHEARLDKALQSYQTALNLGNLNAKLSRFAEQRIKMLKQVVN